MNDAYSASEMQVRDIKPGETAKTNERHRKTDYPVLSVIIPVYNTPQQAFDRMIQSVKGQRDIDQNQVEIILIDDGSKRECAEYLDKIKAEANNISVNHISNRGISGARNLGIDLARGEYITFVDADDYLDLSFFSQSMKIALKYDADVVYGTFKFDPPVFNIIKQNTNSIDIKQTNEMDDMKCSLLNYSNGVLKYSIPASPWGKLFRTSIVKRILFHEDIRCYEDQIFNREFINHAAIAVSTPYVWYYYVQEESSITHSVKTHDNFFAENKPFMDKLLALNSVESEYVQQIARISNMNHYGAIVLNGYVNSGKPWRTIRKQMQAGMNHPLMVDTLQHLKESCKYMNRIERIKSFLFRHRLYLGIFMGLKLLYRPQKNK